MKCVDQGLREMRLGKGAGTVETRKTGNPTQMTTSSHRSQMSGQQIRVENFNAAVVLTRASSNTATSAIFCVATAEKLTIQVQEPLRPAQNSVASWSERRVFKILTTIPSSSGPKRDGLRQTNHIVYEHGLWTDSRRRNGQKLKTIANESSNPAWSNHSHAAPPPQLHGK